MQKECRKNAERRSPQELREVSLEDRQAALAALAIAQHRLGDTRATAIAQRLHWHIRRIRHALHYLSRDDLIAYDESSGQWRLTEQGWHAVGQNPPQWMEARYV